MQAHQLNWIANFIRGIADSVRTGYEISFTRDFSKPQLMGSPKEIRADILAVRKESEGLLEDISWDGLR